MASRALSLLIPASSKHSSAFDRRFNSFVLVSTLHCFRRTGRSNYRLVWNCSSGMLGHSSLPPPDVRRLAETARISLTENEVEEFAPKIRRVIDWFGQLQAADLNSVEPAIRADTEGENLREDIPETFHNRDAMIGSVPSYEEPYIKVPKVLNKE